MSSSVEERCMAARLCLASITPLVRAFSPLSSRSSVSTLYLQRCDFMRSCAQLEDIHPSLYDVQHCWDRCRGGPPAASCPHAAEPLLSIKTFTTLIDALLVKLDRAARAHAGSMEDGGFRVLWGLLFDACSVVNLFPELWPADHLPPTKLAPLPDPRACACACACVQSTSIIAWERQVQQLARSEQPRRSRILADLQQLNVWKRSTGCVSVMEAKHRPDSADGAAMADHSRPGTSAGPNTHLAPAVLAPGVCVAVTGGGG
ncbi:MAG: hypothetical protein WDW36_001620 [Sanguina aurantia]